jgi:DNA-directed RNA polymerase subunit F
MDVINEDDVSMHDAKAILDTRKDEKEFVYDQKICYEYLTKACKLTPAQVVSIKEELSKISILKPRYIALILNIMPETEEEVNMLFSKERTNLKKDEIGMITTIVKKYKK